MKQITGWIRAHWTKLIVSLGLLSFSAELALAHGDEYHGGGMMGGGWGFWMGFGWLWMLLLVALIVLAIAALVKYVSGPGSPDRSANHGQEDSGSGRRA